MQQYAKTIVAVITAILIALKPVIVTAGGTEWITIALAVLGAISVYLVPNKS